MCERNVNQLPIACPPTGTTKELKKKHSSILVGGAERMCCKATEQAGEAAPGRIGSPNSCVNKVGGATGE